MKTKSKKKLWIVLLIVLVVLCGLLAAGYLTVNKAFSVITDYQRGIKYPLAYPELTPDVAIVDPELAFSMPPVPHSPTEVMIQHRFRADRSVVVFFITNPSARGAL